MAPRQPLKRFYQTAEAHPVAQGYHITLDDKPARTPAGQTVLVQNAGLAAALAEEWNKQRPFIEWKSMGLGQLVNGAIDRITANPASVCGEIAAYAASDLLCYRAEGPEALVRRQAAAWDPLLDWAAGRYGARLKVTSGILAVEQDAAALATLRAPVAAADPFQLSAMRAAVGLCGSLIVVLALNDGHLDAAGAWRVTQIDEDWQREKWGQDTEAAASQADAFTAFSHAAHMLALLR